MGPSVMIDYHPETPSTLLYCVIAAGIWVEQLVYPNNKDTHVVLNTLGSWILI